MSDAQQIPPVSQPWPDQPSSHTVTINGEDIQTILGGLRPGKYIAKVNRTKCIGAGPCAAVAPAVFRIDDENKAEVISQDELDDIKLLAAQSCPVAAIIIEDIETGEVVWPITIPEA